MYSCHARGSCSWIGVTPLTCRRSSTSNRSRVWPCGKVCRNEMHNSSVESGESVCGADCDVLVWRIPRTRNGACAGAIRSAVPASHALPSDKNCKSRGRTLIRAGDSQHCWLWLQNSSCVSVGLVLLSQNARRKSNKSLVFIKNCEAVNTHSATGVYECLHSELPAQAPIAVRG